MQLEPSTHLRRLNKTANCAYERKCSGLAPKSRKSSACGGPGGRAGRRLVRRISTDRSPASFPWPPKPWRRRATGHRELPFPPMDPVLFSERTMPDSGGRSHRLREARRRLADRHPPHKSPRANPGRGKTCGSLGRPFTTRRPTQLQIVRVMEAFVVVLDAAKPQIRIRTAWVALELLALLSR